MYIVVGGNGFLGSYLVTNILKNSNEKIIASYNSGTPFKQDNNIIWQKLDVTDVESVESFFETIRDNKQPEEKIKCVYLAGYIKPDDVEKNPNIAWKVNIDGLTNFLVKAQSIIDTLIFSSTDMAVGESTNDYKFKETDIPNPVNLYGEMKLTCENIVNLAGFTSVRLPLMFGKSLIPNRPHFIEHIEQAIKEKKEFEILSDYYESTLDYDTVAKLILNLLTLKNLPKLIHIGADDKISKYELACNYADNNKLDKSYLKPLLLKDAVFFVAKRCDILLDNSLLKTLLGLDKICINMG